jgi:hypothetical protein
MQPREALVIKKVLDNFPKVGVSTMIIRSEVCDAYPDNKKHSVRVDMTMDGMVFEDDPDIKGSKITWILDCDIRGCIPLSILKALSMKIPKGMRDNLIKACYQI